MKLFNALCALVVAATLLAFSHSVRAQEEPEAVYAKFHRATKAADFDEMKKYGTAARAGEVDGMPESQRQAMLRFMAQLAPATYSITGRGVSPDGKRATLRVTAPGSQPGKPQTVHGTIAKLKEGGAWKVDMAEWGGAPADHGAAALIATPAAPAPAAKGPSPRTASREVQRAAQPAQAPRPVSRPASAECVYKPVMTDEDIAKCS